MTNILLMNKENCALKLVYEIILYYDVRSKNHQINLYLFIYCFQVRVKRRFVISGLEKMWEEAASFSCMKRSSSAA